MLAKEVPHDFMEAPDNGDVIHPVDEPQPQLVMPPEKTTEDSMVTTLVTLLVIGVIAFIALKAIGIIK